MRTCIPLHRTSPAVPTLTDQSIPPLPYPSPKYLQPVVSTSLGRPVPGWSQYSLGGKSDQEPSPVSTKSSDIGDVVPLEESVSHAHAYPSSQPKLSTVSWFAAGPD